MRILVVSDVHANLPALEAVLNGAPEHDAIWNLGDTVGYGAHPNESLELLDAVGAHPFLVGNHDLAAVELLPIKWFNANAATAARWTSNQLTDENRFRIRTSFTSEVAGAFYLVHGSPRDPARDYVQSLDDAVDSLGAVAERFVLCGHTHVPMLAEIDPEIGANLVRVVPETTYSLQGKRALLNPGSIGQPRDGDARASALLLDTEGLTATWIRVPYDIEHAQRAILDAGLPKELATRLSRGR
jgi:diadenosine tetraphosphatase ApaH/serine/threonine PP2A family protein phosphatase